MDIIPLTCSACGATIKLKDGQATVTCKFCNATQSLVPSIGSEVERFSAERDLRQAEQRLSNFEQGWLIAQQQHYVKPALGRAFMPTRAAALLYCSLGLALLSLSVLTFVVASSGAVNSIIVTALIVFVGSMALLAIGWNIWCASQQFASVQGDYLANRDVLLQELRMAQKRMRQLK